MKNSNVVKFSLTLVCAAVLSACGSSGGGSAPVQAPKEQPKEEIKETPKEVSHTATFGHQLSKKVKSNFNNVGNNETTNDSSQAIGMNNVLDASLDTVVVAHKDGARTLVYLEDFDFRGNEANTSGTHTLEHIHLDANGNTKAAGNSTARTTESRTKTALKGNEKGTALVYNDNAKLYVYKDAAGTAGASVAQGEALRDLEGSVAEVYGARTFRAKPNGATTTAEASDAAQDSATAITDAALKNAPLQVKDITTDAYTVGKQLEYVQYGRVTTKLHNVGLEDLREGKNLLVNGKTYVASYGQFGADGTENHYFYRTNSSTKGSTAWDGKKDGVLEFNGHAVTYGLDHSLTGDARDLGNAIGGQKTLLSGTHVTATIKLDDKSVSGNLYDRWSLGQAGAEKEHKQKLVNFIGTFDQKNGAIAGTSQLEADANNKGSFNANLYGSKGLELGGAVASNISGDNSWGAVFGATGEHKATPTTKDNLSFIIEQPK